MMVEGIGDERIVGGRKVDETHASIVVCERIVVVVLRDCHFCFAVKRKREKEEEEVRFRYCLNICN